MTTRAPAIVGTIADLETLQALPDLEDAIAACDYLEFRVDALLAEAALLEERLVRSPKPVVLTVRDTLEGGVGDLPKAERLRHFRHWLPSAAIIDLEIRNLPNFALLVEEARQRNLQILGSAHDFEGTPDAEILAETVAGGRAAGADAIKLAVTLRDGSDLATLLQIFERESREIPMAVMGMGPLGMSSRILFAECGSLLSYTYLKNPNAPGQWSSREMRRLFEAMKLPGACA